MKSKSKIKQERYNYLMSLDEEASDMERTERIQLFYELNPNYWDGDCSPKECYGIDTDIPAIQKRQERQR